MPKSCELKNWQVDVIQLISEVEHARKFTWIVTAYGPKEADAHCLICLDVIVPEDCEAKVRSKEEIPHLPSESTEEKHATVRNEFLCWYCYDRFVKRDGLTALEKMLKE